MITWKIENIEQTDGSTISVVAWRANSDHGATAYGAVSIEDLTINASTTEEHVIQRVKEALNAYEKKLDDNGNPIPPKAGEETARTDAIEASLVAQDEELAHPKTHSVELPWVQPSLSPAPPPASNKKSGAK